MQIVYHVETSARITKREPCVACAAPTADYVVVGKGQGRVKVLRLCRDHHTPEDVEAALAPVTAPEKPRRTRRAKPEMGDG